MTKVFLIGWSSETVSYFGPRREAPKIFFYLCINTRKYTEKHQREAPEDFFPSILREPFLISGVSKPFLIFVSLWVAQTVSYNMVPCTVSYNGGGESKRVSKEVGVIRSLHKRVCNQLRVIRSLHKRVCIQSGVIRSLHKKLSYS